jgi:hypothetical protein
VVVPSPVHYDRAGRRVIDPSWQETMYQMIEADRAARDREAQRDAQETPAAAADTANQGSGPEVQDVRTVRETVFVVPGPAIWRIRGTLTVAKGMLALEDDEGVLWYLPGLDRYIGFIDGLDAGERAALEGYAPPRGSSQERYFQPIKLFIDEMEYDLAIPPEGMYLGGQTTIIREIERPAAAGGQAPQAAVTNPAVATNGDTGGQTGGNGADPEDRGRTEQRSRDKTGTGRRERRDSPVSQPVWEHRHTSPWAPPASVLDFDMDYDSFWRDDPARQEWRERDSREIWY